MLKRLLFLSTMVVSCLMTNGQDCPSPILSNGSYLNANRIRTLIPASGSLFWDASDAQFNIQGSGGGFATIFAHGLWLGAEDPGGNLAISAPTYGASGGDADYYPGPVSEDGSINNEDCVNYNRAWSVFRYEIEAHIADFEDNGTIDNPSSAILAWPGTGNPQSLAENGFELLVTPQGMAPFFDRNEDGIYQPLQGDYPFAPQSETIPDQLVWSVFNTVGGPANDSGSPTPMRAEIQLLAWAFNCTDSPALTNTVFTSYKIISRSIEPYSNLRIGLWTDFDLGCYEDDYVGSAPELNSFYVYNQSPVDGVCSTPVPNIGENPPVQAITVLNQPLDGFMYMVNSAVGSGFPISPELISPVTPNEIYFFLNNRFTDGTPLSFGGTGYDPLSTDLVNHAWSGDPNEADSWSEIALDYPASDRRGLGNIAGPSLFLPGQVYTIDVAYSYHRALGAGHLGNVTTMYEGIAALQADYDNNFALSCNQVLICEDDCIWSGDLNADGIANHEDIIALGFDLDATGATRDLPYNWAPQSGESWAATQLLSGADRKHLDANGDGQADQGDKEQIVQHYGFTRPDYVPVFEYPEGDDLRLRRLTGDGFTDLEPGESFTALAVLDTDIPDLRALAFTLEYDPAYIESFIFFSNGEAELELSNAQIPGAADYAHYLPGTEEYIMPGSQIMFRIRMLDFPEELLDSEETTVRFRNIRGYLSDGTEVDLGAQEALFQVNGIAVSTEEPTWAEGIHLFPNPITDRLNWTFGKIVPTAYRLLDMQGRTLEEGAVAASGLDLRILPKGIYSLQFIHAESTVVRKVVKQ